MNIPAIAADSNEANIPATTAFTANRAIVERFSGARPPIKIAIELKFANPQRANEIFIAALSEKSPITEPAPIASSQGTPIAKASGAKKYIT